MKSWKRLPELNFNFRGAIFDRLYASNVKFELGASGESFAVDENSFSVESCVLRG